MEPVYRVQANAMSNTSFSSYHSVRRSRSVDSYPTTSASSPASAYGNASEVEAAVINRTLPVISTSSDAGSPVKHSLTEWELERRQGLPLEERVRRERERQEQAEMTLLLRVEPTSGTGVRSLREAAPESPTDDQRKIEIVPRRRGLLRHRHSLSMSQASVPSTPIRSRPRYEPRPETGEHSSCFCVGLPLKGPGAASMTSTADSRDREPPTEKPSVVDLLTSSFRAISGATRQGGGSKSRRIEPDASPQLDDDPKHKRRQSRPYSIWKRLNTILNPILYQGDTHKRTDASLSPGSTSTNSLLRVSSMRTAPSEGIHIGLSIGVDRVVSLLKDKSGVGQILHLKRDEAQEYANILDAVRYFITRVTSLI